MPRARIRRNPSGINSRHDLFHTYFIAALKLNLVKIGKAIDIGIRFDQLQAMSPAELVCIGWIPFDCETRAHNKFIDYRVRGEWFEIVDPILYFISSAAKPGLPSKNDAHVRVPYDRSQKCVVTCALDGGYKCRAKWVYDAFGREIVN